MKTPVRELYDKLWEADKDRFVWASILAEMIEKEKEAMERYKALLEITNEPDVDAWERKMKERAIEFATNCTRPNFIEVDEVDGYFMLEKQYNEEYESDE